jgi:hypothetical protein
MNQLLAVLPEKFRKNQITGRLVTEIEQPEPGHLSSPLSQSGRARSSRSFSAGSPLSGNGSLTRSCILLRRQEPAPRTLKTPTPKRCLRFCCFLIICVLKRKLCNQPAANTSCVRSRLMQFQRRPQQRVKNPAQRLLKIVTRHQRHRIAFTTTCYPSLN